MEKNEVLLWIKKRKLLVFSILSVLFIIIGFTIWYRVWVAPQKEFEEELKPLLKEYSLIIDDINDIYTDETISIGKFGEKSEEISDDISDLKKETVRIETPNDKSKEILSLFINTLKLGIESIEKGGEANETYLQLEVSRESLDYVKSLYWSSQSDINEARKEVNEWEDRWSKVVKKWRNNLREYRKTHNNLLKEVEDLDVIIQKLKFKSIL